MTDHTADPMMGLLKAAISADADMGLVDRLLSRLAADEARRSEDAFVAALAAAQAEMANAAKDSNNPAFKSKYADLASVRDAVVPCLAKHGIAVMQPVIETDAGDIFVRTRLKGHGHEERCDLRLIIGKRDMQGLGSAITYARRYGLMAMAGIAPDDDDDGNAATVSARESRSAASTTGEGLRNAWRDAVLDELPADASPRQKAEAFATAICDDFARKKGEKALDNAWDRHRKMIDGFSERHADLHAKIVDAFEVRRNEIIDDGKPDPMPEAFVG